MFLSSMNIEFFLLSNVLHVACVPLFRRLVRLVRAIVGSASSASINCRLPLLFVSVIFASLNIDIFMNDYFVLFEIIYVKSISLLRRFQCNINITVASSSSEIERKNANGSSTFLNFPKTDMKTITIMYLHHYM